jgi:hypothetical protein
MIKSDHENSAHMGRMRLMRPTLLSIMASSALLALATSASADVFSSQGFSGSTSSMESLPGVNLDAGTVLSQSGENCVESTVPSYMLRGNSTGGTMTECRFGRFSLNSVRSGDQRPLNDLTYGGNPPPWEQGWKPGR